MVTFGREIPYSRQSKFSTCLNTTTISKLNAARPQRQTSQWTNTGRTWPSRLHSPTHAFRNWGPFTLLYSLTPIQTNAELKNASGPFMQMLKVGRLILLAASWKQGGGEGTATAGPATWRVLSAESSLWDTCSWSVFWMPLVHKLKMPINICSHPVSHPQPRARVRKASCRQMAQ